MNVKNVFYGIFSCQKIWRVRNKGVTLHSLSGSKPGQPRARGGAEAKEC